MAPNAKPVKQIRRRDLRAAIWPNRNRDNEVWFTVTISRRYKEGDEWKDSTSFRHDDLPTLRKVLDKADNWIDAQLESEPIDESGE